MRFQIRILIIRSRLSLAPIAALHILARVDEATSVRYRFLVDGVRRHWISMKASLGTEELEDWPPQGRFLGIVDVDPVHVSNEPPAQPRLSSDRCEHVPNEGKRLFTSQLDRGDLLRVASKRDRCPAGRTQVACPIGFTKRADQAAPTVVLADCHGSRTRQPSPPPLNRDQNVRSQGHADGEERLRDAIEEGNPPRQRPPGLILATTLICHPFAHGRTLRSTVNVCT